MNKYIKLYSVKKRSNLKLKYYLSSIVAVIVTVFAFSGYTAKSNNYIILSLFLLWLFTAFITDLNTFSKMVLTKPMAFFLVFLLFYFVTLMINASFRDVLKYVAASLILFSPMMIFLYYYTLSDHRYLKFITVSTLIAWGYFALKAIRFYSVNENAARILASDRTAFDNIAIGGGYGIAYASCFLAVYIFDFIIRNKFKKKYYTVLAVLAILVLYVVVLETKSTITIIFLYIGFALDILFRVLIPKIDNIRIKLALIFGFLIMLILLIVIFYNLKNMGEFILNSVSGKTDVVSKRIEEIGYLLKYGSAETGYSSDLNGRIELIKQSFQTFFDNFFIGIGYKYGYSFRDMYRIGVGSHSELVDSLAKFGIIGAIPFFGAIWSSIKLERKYSRVSIVYLITTLFLGTFNPFITYQSTIALFLIIPGIAILYHDKKQGV